MPRSEAKAKANAKWDAENMGRVTLSLRKTLIKQIQEAADREGITRDRWLKNIIKGKLEEEK
jgi:metal-responsive CopG/Arc/MetJ family transcriptional regulator